MTTGSLLLLLLTSGALLNIASTFESLDLYEDETEDVPREFEPLDRWTALRRYLARNRENRRDAEDEFENWQGRWMPDRPGQPTPPPKVFGKDTHDLHGVPMGQPSDQCDDAKTNLTMDWDYSPVNYTCFDSKIVPDRNLSPKLYCEMIPKSYVALHKCMNEKLEYDDDIPLFGTHRPLWPAYGEYKFLPKQRWLHSLEHGAIVMLYHPCANPLEVKRLKSLLTRCLRRHIITPYNLLSEEQPLALLSWGCRLTMSHVNPVIVSKFIQEYALRGPESIPEDGDFKEYLQLPARTVSDKLDSVLCPQNLEF